MIMFFSTSGFQKKEGKKNIKIKENGRKTEILSKKTISGILLITMDMLKMFMEKWPFKKVCI